MLNATSQPSRRFDERCQQESVCITIPRTVSCSVTTVTAVAAAIPLAASGAAPTPLYHQHQEHFSLTPFMITIIFAAYVLCLLFAGWDLCRTT